MSITVEDTEVNTISTKTLVRHARHEEPTPAATRTTAPAEEGITGWQRWNGRGPYTVLSNLIEHIIDRSPDFEVSSHLRGHVPRMLEALECRGERQARCRRVGQKLAHSSVWSGSSSTEMGRCGLVLSINLDGKS